MGSGSILYMYYSILYKSFISGKVYSVHCTPPLPYVNRGIGIVENTVKVIVTARKMTTPLSSHNR